MSVAISFAQTTLYEDDFESYTAGSNISETDNWTTWSGNSGGSDDAVVSDEQNNTDGGANSLKIVPNNDIVFFFGDKSDGVYDVNFWYYVPTGKSGYFNVEHDFGATWAFSVEFTDGGAGELSYNNESTAPITFPHDTWFPIEINVDIDNDEITLTVNSAEIANWTFSTVESSDEISNVLDCVNFYGGGSSDGWQYYVDDFEFIEVVGGSEPQDITVDLDEITSTGASQSLVISNEGDLALDFKAYPYYPVGTAKKINNNETISNKTSKTVILGTLESVKIENSAEYNNDSKDVTLKHYTAAPENGLGWGGTENFTIHAAVLFDNEMIADYIGMEVSSLTIFVGDAPVGNPTAEVWEGFSLNNNGPIDLMSEEEFTTAGGGPSEVVLTTPVTITGKDLWAGWEFVQSPGTYVLGMTDNEVEAATPDVNFVKSGVVWQAVNDWGNFGIAATLTGEAINTWLSVDVTEGTIPGGGMQEIEVSFDATDMESGLYECTLVIQNNDLDESWYEIPVTLDISSDINSLNAKIGVMTFPNPAKTELNVVANDQITKITVVDLSGKVINEFYPNMSNFKINTENFNSGLYILNVETEKSSSSQKIIIE